MSSSYSSQLRDARWQRKRLEIMERDEFACRSCGASDKDEGTTLNVHHSYYIRGKKPWEYPKNALVTFCEDCHKSRHNWKPLLDEAIASMTQLQFSGLCKMLHYSFDSDFFEAIGECDNIQFYALSEMARHLQDAWEDGHGTEKN